jgi:hypothetical protein
MLLDPRLEHYRIVTGELASAPGSPYGAFRDMPGPSGRRLTMICDDGHHKPFEGWEHVSVSTERRSHLPNWIEMDWVKGLFWTSEEAVMQLHPPRSRWVDNYSCLHLWRPIDIEIPLPPPILVGIKEAGEINTPEQAQQLQQLIDKTLKDAQAQLGTKG